MARATYVLVLQAGDHFANMHSLSKAKSHLAQDVDIVSFDVLQTNGSSRQVLKSSGFDRRFDFFMSMPHQGAFCRGELFDRCGQFDRSFSVTMDYNFYFHACAAGAWAVVVNEVISIMPEGGISTMTDWPSQKSA